MNSLGPAKDLDLGIAPTTLASRLIRSSFASLAEHDRESIQEKTTARRQPAAARGKHSVRPKEPGAENLGKAKKTPETGRFATEAVELTGTSDLG